jgi:HEAT repeat protein
VGFFSRSPVKQLAEARDVDGLVSLLGSPKPKVRADAANALGGLELQATGAEDALLARLDDSDTNVRCQVAFALGQIRSKAAWDPLEGMLSDADSMIRLFAVNALSFIDPVRAGPTIAPLAHDPESLVREQVALCLAMAE